MKLSVQQTDLAQAVSIVFPAFHRRSSLPILHNVLLRTEDGGLRAAATNLEVTISCHIDAVVTEDGETTVPAIILRDIVAGATGRIGMDLFKRTQKLTLLHGGGESTVKGIDAQEFPVVRQPDQDDRSLILDASLLALAIRQVVFAALRDNSRPILMGVLLEFDGSRLTLAAADGVQLAVRSIPANNSGDAFKIIVPATSLAPVGRLCKEAETVSLYRAGAGVQQALFEIGSIVIASQLIDGHFPDYRQIIPNSHATRTVVGTGDLLRACKIACIFARGGGDFVRIHSAPGKMTVVGRSFDGDGESKIDAQVVGEGVDAIYHEGHLLAYLSAADTPEVAMETITASSAAVFRPVGSDDGVFVIAPMELR